MRDHKQPHNDNIEAAEQEEWFLELGLDVELVQVGEGVGFQLPACLFEVGGEGVAGGQVLEGLEEVGGGVQPGNLEQADQGQGLEGAGDVE